MGARAVLSTFMAIQRQQVRHALARLGRLPAPLRHEPALNLGHHRRMRIEEPDACLPALGDLLAVEGEPPSDPVDNPGLGSEVQDLCSAANSRAVADVELDLLEGCRQLVLDDPDAGSSSRHSSLVLQHPDPANLEALARVELQGFAAWRRLLALSPG